MAKLETDDLCRLCTEIGCIMEDACLVALVWDAGDGLGVQARIKKLSDAHSEIGILLSQIKDLP